MDMRKQKNTSPHLNVRMHVLRYASWGLLTTFLCLIGPVQVHAKDGASSTALQSIKQTKTITGTVVDEMGEPLIGVSVLVKGTTTGTVTDFDGKFSLPNVPANVTLVISYIGYQTENIKVGNQTRLSVTMKPNNQVLDEVVVVGYGTMKKVDLTGTVASVKGGDLAQIPVTTAAEAITGKLAGVQVTTVDGSPDADVKIRVRGGGSITQDNSPLYIIDGFPVENGLSLIAPTDIERIDVLKDASSTAIYGARGANGVVIITTKSGSDKRFSVNFDAYLSTKEIANRIDVLDAYGFVKSAYERARLASPNMDTEDMQGILERYGEFTSYKNRYSNATTDWQDKLFRSGLTQNYNFSANGGNKDLKYTMGITRTLNEGAMLGSDYSRTLMNGKVEYTANEHLTVGFSTRYNHNKTYGGTVSSRNAAQYRPTEGLSGEFDINDFDSDYYMNNDLLNPILLSEREYSKKLNDNFNVMGEISYKIGDFVIKAQGGIDKYNSKSYSFYGPYTKNYLQNGMTVGGYSTKDTDKWINTNTINWNHKFGDHSVSVLLGQEWSDMHTKSFAITGKGWNDYITPEKAFASMSMAESLDKPTTSEDSYQLFSFFGRASYDYKGKYIANVSLRADGSSMFAKENRWGYFPSVGASWRISEEEFMKEWDWISNLKIRYSFGVAGNDRITSMMWTTKWITDSTTQYGVGNTLHAALKPNTLGNRNLKWETTISNNLGIDMGFFDNRLNITVDYYYNKVKDLLLSATLPANAGFSDVYKNVGSTRNSGFEFVVDGTLISTKDITWTAGFNISFNRSKVLALQDGTDIMYGSPKLSTSGPANEYLVKVGQPLGQLYGYVYDGWYTADDFVEGSYNSAGNTWTLKEDVVQNSTAVARPGYIKFKNMTEGDKVIDSDDMTVIGNTAPKHFGGFNTSFRYKSFDLTAAFNWSYGNDIYNATKIQLYDGTPKETNLSADFANAYTLLDDSGNIITSLSELNTRNAKATMYSPYLGSPILHSGLIEDGSFLRLNNLTIGYTFPQKWTKVIGLNKARLYVTGTNLFCITSYSGYDPEVDAYSSNALTPGVDSWGYPKTRSYVFGVNLTF